MKLLVCIAAHYAPERLKYLYRVQKELAKYECEVNIIIDTNEYTVGEDESDMNKVIAHENLEHPFHLTQMHRHHFKCELENYDWFCYIEDDILLPWQNFHSYTQKFPLMWPDYVPSFIRIEQKDGQDYISDVTEHYKITDFIWIDGRPFINLPFPQHYHAFWIAPQYALKESINNDFTKLHDSREKAASYLMWELGKNGLLEVENQDGKFQIKEDCYSYHLPNNYIDSDMKNGKILVKKIFI